MQHLSRLPELWIDVIGTIGSEKQLQRELSRLSLPAQITPYRSRRGLKVSNFQTKDLHKIVYKLNYQSRLASRVFVPCIYNKSPMKDPKDLYRLASNVPWKDFIQPSQTFAIDANINRSQVFDNSLYVAQVIKDAIVDQLKIGTF